MTTKAINKRDKWIPWYFVAFFVVLAVMDGIFVYLATNTHTGVVTEQAYDRGLNYNETVAAAEAQAALGWSADINYQESGKFVFQLFDDGEPLVGANVIAEFMRPTHNGVDFDVPLIDLRNGTYQSAVDFPLEGIWDVRVYVTWNQQQFQQSKRLIVK